MEEKTAVKKSFKKMPRKKVCAFCQEKIDQIDYKDVNRLKKYRRQNPAPQNERHVRGASETSRYRNQARENRGSSPFQRRVRQSADFRGNPFGKRSKKPSVNPVALFYLLFSSFPLSLNLRTIRKKSATAL